MQQATPKATPKLLVPKANAQLSLGIVVAMGLNREIGQAGVMPWYLPEDLKHFKQATMHSCVIMGRKTFESIGRPLPSRRNIVVSQDRTLADKYRLEVASSLPEALELAAQAQGAMASAQQHGVDLASAERIEYEQCFVIGGARLFAEALQLADKVVITHIRSYFADADVFFPKLPAERQFKLVSVSPAQAVGSAAGAAGTVGTTGTAGTTGAAGEAGLAESSAVDAGAFRRYFNSQAEQPAQFKQSIPAVAANILEYVDAEGQPLAIVANTGLDYCFATYQAQCPAQV